MNSLERRVEKLEQHQFAPRAGRSAQFDYDAGTIYRATPYLSATVYSYDKIKSAGIYDRGRELHEKRYGPIVPAYLDPHLKRSTLASIEFEFVFDREPKVGDILRFEHVATLHAAEVNAYYFGEFIAAWHRQLSHLECPLRFEDGTLFKRLMQSPTVDFPCVMSFVPGIGAVQTRAFHRSHRSNDKGGIAACELISSFVFRKEAASSFENWGTKDVSKRTSSTTPTTS